MAWKVYTRDVEGNQAQILVDDSFDWTAPVPNLTNLTVISIFCRQQPETTLWHPDEAEALDNLEERLINFAEDNGHGWAVYVLRMASYGVREYYFYHSEQAELGKAFERMKNMHPDYRIEMTTTPDPDWKHYRNFVVSQ